MLLELKNIYKNYIQGTMEVPVLKDINLCVEEGEYVAIMGPSGSGKSTLMNIIGCIDKPTSGTYLLDDVEIEKCKDKELSEVRNQKIGFVFQNFNLLPRQSALDNVALPLQYAKVPIKKRKQKAKEMLEMVDLADRVSFKPTQLSGGQKQRVAIAGVMAMEPKCIVLDEPTAMLDPNGRKEVLHAAHELNRKKGVTILLITHYMEEVVDADYVYVMDKGHVVMQGTPREIFSQVGTLKEHRLDVPQITLLADLLRQSGLDIPLGVLTREELVDVIMKIAG